MTPSISNPYSDTELPRKPAAPAKAHGPFSRASHFALILVPVMLGVGFSFTQDAALTAPLLFIVLALFFCGLGGALALLWGVKKVEEWEEKSR